MEDSSCCISNITLVAGMDVVISAPPLLHLQDRLTLPTPYTIDYVFEGKAHATSPRRPLLMALLIAEAG